MDKEIHIVRGEDIQDWCTRLPLLTDIIKYRETIWSNPMVGNTTESLAKIKPGGGDIDDAANRLDRFRPFIARSFPETKSKNGLIESPLLPIPQMQKKLSDLYSIPLPGRLLLKCDNLLPISGSVKARGGIYEVLKHAEQLALSNNLINPEDDYAILTEETARQFFARYQIAVGSTGNLGLSIGIIGAQFGFKVTVHMSAEAREWKKKLLRSHGVEVVQYDADYSIAVAEGRRQAANDPFCYFIDDENSVDLFLGYAVAGRRLQRQLSELSIPVDGQHPLFVYLPCGVGGAPGGITYGLKQIFGDNVHCFFAEPTHSPCMLLGLYTGLHDKISIGDFGLNNKTEADGLAVTRPSGFIGKIMAPLIDGVLTADDSEMFKLLALLADTEGIRMEPSALAGMVGPTRICSSVSNLEKYFQKTSMENVTHVVWGTGGCMVPAPEMEEFYQRGKSYLYQGHTP